MWTTWRELLLPDGDILPPTRPRRNLESQLRVAIRTGRLLMGTRMPSSRALAEHLGVSRGTVVAVYDQLVAEGFLVARRGSGTRVASGAHPVAAPSATGRPVPARVVHQLSPGLPSLAIFPRAAWLLACRAGLATLTDEELGYPDPAGLPTLRAEVAAYLGRVRSMPTHPDDLVITHGTFDSLALLADCLLAAGHTRIAVEDPSNPHQLALFRDRGLEPVPITVDSGGLDVAALPGTHCRAVLVTACHQYPLGSSLAAPRRRELLRWASEQDAIVVEDDYDAEYRYDRPALTTLRAIAPEQVVYLGTLSKTLAPGLRVGWLAAPSWLRQAVARRKLLGDRGGNVMVQAGIEHFLRTGGYDRHLRRTRLRYRRLREALLNAVATYLPACTPIGINAGLHIVLRLPNGTDDRRLTDRLAQLGIEVDALSQYTHKYPTFPGLLLGWARARPDQLVVAVQTIAAALDDDMAARAASPASP